MSGTHMVIAPVAGTPNIAIDPCPSWNTQVMTPYAAASEIRLNTTALSARTTDRKARVSRMNVAMAISDSISGKSPYTVLSKSIRDAPSPPTPVTPGLPTSACSIDAISACPAGSVDSVEGCTSTIAVPARANPAPEPGATAAYTPGSSEARAATEAEDPLDVRTSAGVSTPDGTPPDVRLTSASCAGPDVASAADPGVPRCSDSAGIISNAMMPSPTAADTHRCRYTIDAHEENSREGRRSVRFRGQSRRGPTDARITGSSVTATSTDTSGTSTPPYPTLRSIGTGSTIIDTSPIATVSPENTTARPACSIATVTASAFERPAERSSRHRLTTSSE